MRCSACNAENPAGAAKCSSCGAELKRRPRRRAPSDESGTPFKAGDTRDRGALTAYRCAIYGMVPLAGLVLGPAALVLGLLAWRRVKAANDPASAGPAGAAIVLGSLVMVTNWVGVALIVIGLTS